MPPQGSTAVKRRSRWWPSRRGDTAIKNEEVAPRFQTNKGRGRRQRRGNPPTQDDPISTRATPNQEGYLTKGEHITGGTDKPTAEVAPASQAAPYKLGQKARDGDIVRFSSIEEVHKTLPALPIGTPLFVKRSNREWTYARIVSYRRADNTDAGILVDSDFWNEGRENFIVVALDEDYSMRKFIKKEKWHSCVRLVRLEAGRDDHNAGKSPKCSSQSYQPTVESKLGETVQPASSRRSRSLSIIRRSSMSNNLHPPEIVAKNIHQERKPAAHFDLESNERCRSLSASRRSSDPQLCASNIRPERNGTVQSKSHSKRSSTRSLLRETAQSPQPKLVDTKCQHGRKPALQPPLDSRRCRSLSITRSSTQPLDSGGRVPGGNHIIALSEPCIKRRSSQSSTYSSIHDPHPESSSATDCQPGRNPILRFESDVRRSRSLSTARGSMHPPNPETADGTSQGRSRIVRFESDVKMCKSLSFVHSPTQNPGSMQSPQPESGDSISRPGRNVVRFELDSRRCRSLSSSRSDPESVTKAHRVTEPLQSELGGRTLCPGTKLVIRRSTSMACSHDGKPQELQRRTIPEVKSVTSLDVLKRNMCTETDDSLSSVVASDGINYALPSEVCNNMVALISPMVKTTSKSSCDGMILTATVNDVDCDSEAAVAKVEKTDSGIEPNPYVRPQTNLRRSSPAICGNSSETETTYIETEKNLRHSYPFICDITDSPSSDSSTSSPKDVAADLGPHAAKVNLSARHFSGKRRDRMRPVNRRSSNNV